jgi:hypothetical protein
MNFAGEFTFYWTGKEDCKWSLREFKLSDYENGRHDPVLLDAGFGKGPQCSCAGQEGV